MTRPESEPRMSPELRARLLESSPDELLALAERHPEVGNAVDAILQGDRAIEGFLRGAGTDVDALRSAPTPTGADVDVPGIADGRRPNRRIPRGVAGATLLAAAAMAVLLGRDLGPSAESPADPSATRSTPVPAGTPDPGAAAVASRTTLDLEVESPSDFAVFPTDDPDIAVVWFLNGEDR